MELKYIFLILLFYNFLACGEGLSCFGHPWFGVKCLGFSSIGNYFKMYFSFGSIISLRKETCKRIRHAFICIICVFINFGFVISSIIHLSFFRCGRLQKKSLVMIMMPLSVMNWIRSWSQTLLMYFGVGFGCLSIEYIKPEDTWYHSIRAWISKLCFGLFIILLMKYIFLIFYSTLKPIIFIPQYTWIPNRSATSQCRLNPLLVTTIGWVTFCIELIFLLLNKDATSMYPSLWLIEHW